MSAGLVLAATHGLEQDLVIKLGGAAGALALVALALVVPLYVTQRREVRRLERWRELEPERGDEGAPGSFQPGAPVGAPGTAATAATAAAVARPGTGAYTTGRMTPAERVTADRPALSRITAERAAIQSPSFWRRLIARGPRHPLVLAVIAIAIAGGAVAVVGLSTDALDGGSTEKADDSGFDKAGVALVILNGSSTPALADEVADEMSARGFTDVRTSATGQTDQSIVFYAKGSKHAGTAVARRLDVEVIQPMNRDIESLAPDADVVVITGEDRAKA